MKHSNFDSDWTFQYGEPSSIPMLKPQTETVSLPHDFMIRSDVDRDAPGGAETGFFRGGKGSYTKYLTVREDGLKDQVYILSFDGVAGAMKLVVNGHVAKRHHYAYSPFTADITPYLEEGRNRITVTVNNTDEPNSRWYSGSGLYRSVELLTAPKVHIAPEGIFVRTTKVKGRDAHLAADITVRNDSEEDISVSARISIRKKGASSEKWLPAAQTEPVLVRAGEEAEAACGFLLPDASLWDPDNPSLYELRVGLALPEGDTDTVAFGVRTIEMDAEHGLRLNGRPILLKGGCIHHDNGILGACAFRDSEYRKVRLHKDNGFNALRFAHNPMSRHLLCACDEIGMLVIDEAYDVWNMEKNDFDFSQHFADEGERELTNMILRDRNHPCVFLWSIGNEIPEQGGLSGGYETSRHLAALARRRDPTRAVGGALCSFFRGLTDADNEKYWNSILENTEKLKEEGMVNLDCRFGQEVFDPYTAPFVETWDAVGYNYLRCQYGPTHAAHPERVLICTESKPRELLPYWEDVKRLPFLIGDFEWTSMDYLGEAGIGTCYYVEEDEAERTRQMMHMAQYPARTAGSGDFDICGFEKPQLLYRRIVWGSEETAVLTHDPANYGKVEILGRYGWGDIRHDYTWNAAPGDRMRAEIYSSAPEVELIANGISLGRRPAGPAHEYRASFEFAYDPGVLLAISRDAGGHEISRDEIRSAGAPASLKLAARTVRADGREAGIPADGIHLPADGSSLAFVTAEITDGEGRRVPYVEEELTAEAGGAISLLAFGTGRSATEENYTVGKAAAHEGRAMAILRAGREAGGGILTIRSSRFGERTLRVTVG